MKRSKRHTNATHSQSMNNPLISVTLDRTHKPALLAGGLLFLALLCFGAAPAWANPWVLPEGVGIFQVSSGSDFANKEFLPDGTNQIFPLEGEFTSYYLQMGGRYGILPNIEIGANVLFKSVNYDDETLVLNSGTEDQRTLSFDQSATGLGDVFLTGAYQHLTEGVRLASGLSLKFPTGYRSPRETFIEGDSNQIGDDVTLGDGQVDLQYTLESGWFINPTLTLLELDVGYNARFNGPGHQAVGLFKIGQALGQYLFAFAFVEGAFTLFEGEVLGDGLVARDPSVSAEAFDFSNVERIDITRDRDFLKVGGGLIARFQGRELVVQGAHTVLGRNFAQITSISVGTIFVFDEVEEELESPE